MHSYWVFCLFVCTCSFQDLRSPPGDQTHAPCSVSSGVLTTRLPGKSHIGCFFKWSIFSHKMVWSAGICYMWLNLTAGDLGSIPGSGRSPGEGIGYTPVFLAFPCGSAGKESACNVGDLGSIPGLRRSLGEGKVREVRHKRPHTVWFYLY